MNRGSPYLSSYAHSSTRESRKFTELLYIYSSVSSALAVVFSYALSGSAILFVDSSTVLENNDSLLVRTFFSSDRDEFTRNISTSVCSVVLVFFSIFIFIKYHRLVIRQSKTKPIDIKGLVGLVGMSVFLAALYYGVFIYAPDDIRSASKFSALGRWPLFPAFAAFITYIITFYSFVITAGIYKLVFYRRW